jgi:hypothetical protein
MDEEYGKLRQEIADWIESAARRMTAEQKCQHSTRNFGDFSIVMMMDYNKDHGNLELTAYQVDTRQVQDQLSGTVPMLFEEGW